jgi:hypothetical protein
MRRTEKVKFEKESEVVALRTVLIERAIRCIFEALTGIVVKNRVNQMSNSAPH